MRGGVEGSVSLLHRFKKLLDGGDQELGREDLLRQVEEGILALRRHGSRGKEVFPPAVRVEIRAAEGSLTTLRNFVEDPAFERELEARLSNRLVAAEVLPARRYRVEAGPSSEVRVEEDAVALLGRAIVVGGDRDGAELVMEAGRREWRIGRGPWHQERADDQRLPNDLVITETIPYVSRAAALFRRSGAALEVESRQQGEFLIVVRKDGSQLRPAMTASGRVPVRPGDRLDFHDGASERLSVLILPPEA